MQIQGPVGSNPFPWISNKDEVSDPDLVFGEVRSALVDFDLRKPLTLTQIQESHVMLDLVNSTDRLEEQEAAQIIEFNK